MISASTIENYLIVIALIFLAFYGFASLAETKPHWFRSKTFLKTKKIEQSYERMV